MMKFYLVSLSAVCFMYLADGTVAEPPAELRGVWVTRFEWVSTDTEKTRANIREVFETLEAKNFNAVLFQIRGSAETLYPSELEPWAGLIGEKDPGFDPVALAIEEARDRGIEFHAYMNPMPLRETSYRIPPTDLNHLWHRHGPNTHEPWICVDSDGRPARSEYYYLSAGVPGVHAYLRQVIVDVVRRYDVDGIHLDRIRYPGRDYSHDPISRQRFLGRGNPRLLDWADWQREQLDKLINDLAAEIRAEKPRVILSCSAWGIYSRYHVDDYAGFSSGYHDYFQDTWRWVRLGAMDVLVPMIYWRLADPKPNYDELIADFVGGIGPSHLAGGQRAFGPDENIEQIRLTREAAAYGTVLYNFSSARRRGVLDAVHAELYQERAATPVPARVENPELGTVLGTALADDGEPLVDAWVTLAEDRSSGERTGRGRRSADVYSQTWTSSADGRFAFLNVPPGPVQVMVEYEGAPSVAAQTVQVQAGEVARVELTVEGSAEVRDQPYLAVLRPKDGSSTTDNVVHILGRTLPGHRVTVAGDDVEVYTTGGFARDNIPLDMGENRIELTVADRRRSFTRTITITRTEPRPPAAPETLRILDPAENLAVLPGDALEIRAEGPPGLSGRAVLFDGSITVPLANVLNAQGQETGMYTAALRVPESAIGEHSPVLVTLEAGAAAAALEAASTSVIEVWDPVSIRVAETIAEQTGITYGLHSVRLGGPWLAWVPAGTRFEIIGRQGDKCRVRLSESMTGWVSEDQIRLLPAGTPLPRNHFTSCGIDGDDGHDVLSIAMNAPVVVAVRPEIEPNRLYLDFFNTHHAATWISHKSGAQVIGQVTAEQIETDRLRLTVPIESRQIWGYWTEMRGGRFTLRVRRPPVLASFPHSPFTGLTVAVEAGHGGRDSGAVGAFGTKEKTVNRLGADALQRELEARGARVIQIRRGDESLIMTERIRRTNRENADLFVSIHANAASTARGFLRVSGTSMYYHDIHCALPAKLVYDKLLGLDWDEFGVVGNFSYAPLRNTRVPGILVEQAFMSHPGDEARLLDPEYQRQQAIAIADGLHAFLEHARE